MSNVGGFEVAGLALLYGGFFLLWIGSFVFLIVALVDICKRPEWQWKLAGQEKILWILLVVLINFLCIPCFIYWFSIRKRLIAVDHDAKAGRFGMGQMTPWGWQPNPPPPFYPVAAGPPPGWHADPSGQHAQRYWDGANWTEHVSDVPTTTASS